MKDDRFDKLLAFLQRLQKAKISYSLRDYREEAISVEIYAPGEHWEVDFLADGEIDVERYRSNGHIYEEAALEELFALCSDEVPAAPQAASTDGATRRE